MRCRRICFVTGTRAEFGLMRSALDAIRTDPRLKLQLIVTGMHLDKRHGYSLRQIRRERWLDGVQHAIVPWRPLGAEPHRVAAATGNAMASMTKALQRLRPDIVLVCGDRVEAFAAASAAHLTQTIVAHVHGGDRALGQVDDALRHAITKLAHLHFAATADSARRLVRLGEDRWRIRTVGAPGIDGIRSLAESSGLPKRRFALIVLHPIEADDRAEFRRAKLVLDATRKLDFEPIVIVYPNSDPGSRGIIRCWQSHARGRRFHVHADVARGTFLGLLRDAAVLVGNSSSGIIEAATFGTPVLDIGPRQQGRMRSPNVTNVPYDPARIARALVRIWNAGRPKGYRARNVYGSGGAGARIADILGSVPLAARIRRKLIAY